MNMTVGNANNAPMTRVAIIPAVIPGIKLPTDTPNIMATIIPQINPNIAVIDDVINV